MDSKLVTFLRRRDYVLLEELGQGACGKTVLLKDPLLEQNFVCKKYSPLPGLDRAALYGNFVREIKLLHDLHHVNVVRVFNYYLYPEAFSGFILMEYVRGSDVRRYLHENPDQINDVFLQTVQGFRHLEAKSVLHRDVRPANLMVTDDGVVKIIDLGFGKRIEQSADFDKSISLNLWCDPPEEFGTATYDFQTEVYFVGKLFEQILADEEIEHFKYVSLLKQMVERTPRNRAKTFSEVEKTVRSDLFVEIQFSDEELDAYREFADELTQRITKIERNTTYVDDIDRIRSGLKAVLRTVTLEREMSDAAPLSRCFLNGEYFYKKLGFPVAVLKGFVSLFACISVEKQKLVIANLHTRFDSVTRYTKPKPRGFDDLDDDIPF
jgi:eukaryotic-like serine/threonine-protein kinase